MRGVDRNFASVWAEVRMRVAPPFACVLRRRMKSVQRKLSVGWDVEDVYVLISFLVPQETLLAILDVADDAYESTGGRSFHTTLFLEPGSMILRPLCE